MDDFTKGLFFNFDGSRREQLIDKYNTDVYFAAIVDLAESLYSKLQEVKDIVDEGKDVQQKIWLLLNPDVKVMLDMIHSGIVTPEEAKEFLK